MHDAGDEDFDEKVLGSEVPVLVCFKADWCPPCRVQAPALEELAVRRGDTLRVVRVDVDRSRRTQTRFAVRGVPTLLLFRDGEVVRSHVGRLVGDDLDGFVSGEVEGTAGS